MTLTNDNIMTINEEKKSPRIPFSMKIGMNRSVFALIATLAMIAALSANAEAEIRGQITDIGQDTFTWDCENFAGFYYDLDSDICTEKMTFRLSDIAEDKSMARLSDAEGVKYETHTASRKFEFESWGSYDLIGFMGEKYFAGYTPSSDVLFSGSTGKNLLSDEQVLIILVDNDDERTVVSGTPIELEEGYELAIQSIDIEGNKVYLELTNNGEVVDSKVISPSKEGATMQDRTYYYKKDIGDSKDLVIVAAHFKNAFPGADQNLATLDGLWQLSDMPRDVSEDTDFDKMTIQTVTADSITMNNKDNDITLSKNKDISLMVGMGIRTADQDVINKDNPLRYYVYKD